MPPRTGDRLAILKGRAALGEWRNGLAPEATVGLVPTMGALHAGHATLIERAARECAHAVVSVFVNPLQFNERSDYKTYPRDHDHDADLILRHGGEAAWLPSEEEMYPEGFATRIVPGEAGRILEGEHRPGHFEGVLTVVVKLLLQVRPTRAYFGEKDAQQLFLVRRAVADLELPVQIVGCETVREEDGLAFSSRNRHLSAEERVQATALSRALRSAHGAFRAGERDPEALVGAMKAVYEQVGLKPEYAVVVDDRSFAPADPRHPAPWRALTAAWVGETRLLDNLFLGRA